jgi:glutamate dehydrogenase (NAD(P)+)
MAWMMDTYSMHAGYTVPGVVTGKPVSLGGSEGRAESTGRGTVYCLEDALRLTGGQLPDQRVVIQGFGNVGSYAARSLDINGAKVIAVGDATGAIHNANGLNIRALMDWVDTHRGVNGFPEAEAIPTGDLLTMECDMLIPAALERVITAENAGKLRCKVLAEGANGPTTNEADAVLEARNEIFVIPDILCNAGGVIVSYFEWVQALQHYFWTEKEVLQKLETMLAASFREVVQFAKTRNVPNRVAAMAIGVQRVAETKELRGLFP